MVTAPEGHCPVLMIDCMLNRSYAAAIVELLDPSGRLFGQRIISQGAAGDGVQQDLTKRLMQVALCLGWNPDQPRIDGALHYVMQLW